jgi:hypothetical protein
MRLQLLPLALALSMVTTGCGSATAPEDPTSGISFGATSPPAGSTVTVPAEWPYNVPGGVVIPRGSALISLPLSVASGRAVPWAQLSVYLVADQPGSFCGLNDPDAPTWGGLPAGWSTTYTVSGFQVYRLPCEVVEVRAVLHTRNNGLRTLPTPAETVAEAVLPLRLHLRRQPAPE